jgi:DNA-binding transcriptional LysR family regulator
MEWDDLRFLVAVDRSGSLSAAARLLKVDQTTVGRRLEALQKRLGARLIERNADGTRLTAAGRRACAAGVAMEEAALALEREVSGSEERIEGLVRIATAAGFMSVLGQALGEARQLHPGLRFEISTSTVTANLVKGEADFAVRMMRDSQASLVARRIGQNSWGLYASESYVRRKGPARSLTGHDVVGYTDPMTRSPGGQWLAQHEAGANVVARVDNAISALDLAEAGVGLAAAPSYMAEARPGLLSIRAGAIGVSEFFLVAHREVARIPRVRTTMDHIARHVKTITLLA